MRWRRNPLERGQELGRTRRAAGMSRGQPDGEGQAADVAHQLPHPSTMLLTQLHASSSAKLPTLSPITSFMLRFGTHAMHKALCAGSTPPFDSLSSSTTQRLSSGLYSSLH